VRRQSGFSTCDPIADVYPLAMEDILKGYAAAATPAFVAAYDELSSEHIYEHVQDLFPAQSAKVVDIGAGTGRDAAWFAKASHSVLAVEPVAELREAGKALHPSANIDWLDDRLPELKNLKKYGPFDLVTLCAVWQHIPDEARTTAMLNLSDIIARDGLLVMSLRHGPGAAGRRVFPVSVEATIQSAEQCGLTLLRARDAQSVQAGNSAMGVSWTWLAFKHVSF
jgi:SAM-dependent methyltransferase